MYAAKGRNLVITFRTPTIKTRRRFNPNLQPVRVQLPNGGNGRMKVCTRCIKSGKIVKAA
jgi:large subunit ribosomal protein L28